VIPPRVWRARIAVVKFFEWEEVNVLEWKPRFAAVFVLLTLVVVAAIASGYFEFVFDNWEW
jgi:preprotein translocase subunit Sec61beta